MVESGEWLTRGTVWLALTLYVGSQMAARAPHSATARWLNALGCVAFVAHVACAFAFYHHWSHSAAYADTAQQTAKLTGWNSGFGLYVNYFFAAVWLLTLIKPIQHWAVRGFFWFMIFNGAVVFVQSPLRWFGLLLCVILIACWWPNRRRVPK